MINGDFDRSPLPMLQQVAETEGDAADFFESADEVLGKGATVKASGLKMQITVGERSPFSPSGPKLLLPVAQHAPLVSAKSAAKITGKLELKYPAEVATPKRALVQQEGVAGASCEAESGAAVIRIGPAEGETLADVVWEGRALPAGAEAEFQEQLALLNSRALLGDKLALRESRFSAAWPSGSYSLVVTVKNFAGASAETYVAFERSSFALPKIASLGDLEFRRSQGLEVAPVGSSQGCGETELQYLWTSLDGAMPLPNPDAPFLRIPQNAPWTVPGKSYRVSFTVTVRPATKHNSPILEPAPLAPVVLPLLRSEPMMVR